MSLKEFYKHYKIKKSMFADRVFGILGTYQGVLCEHDSASRIRCEQIAMEAVNYLSRVRSDSSGSFVVVCGSLVHAIVAGNALVLSAEFMIGIWNFCTLDSKNMVRFAFELYVLGRTYLVVAWH